VSQHFHIILDEKLSTVQNDTRLEDFPVEPLNNNLSESCCDHYGEEGRASVGANTALDGAIPVDTPLETGGERLTEVEQYEKRSRGESWRSNQHKVCVEQAKDVERIIDKFNPTRPLDDGNVPSSASTSDDDDSNVTNDESIGSFSPCFEAPARAIDPQVPLLPPT
jgi:hypothetical protein